MKLLLVSHSAGLGGAERCLVNLAEAALAEGHEVVVVLPNRGPLAEIVTSRSPMLRIVYTPLHSWMGPRHHSPLGAVRLFQCILNVAPFLKLLRSESPDVVLVNSATSPAPMLASKIANKRTVVMVRESLKTNPMLRTLLPIGILTQLIANWADRVITNSKYVSQQFGFESKVIYPSLNSAFLDARVPAKRLRESGAQLRIVMLGTVSPEKGQVFAVEAVAKAIRSEANVSLTIMGGGRAVDVRQLEEALDAHNVRDRVRYVSGTEDPVSAYEEADVTLVCSRNEAFGKVTIESILCGTPVIGFDAGGTAEILSSGGGLLIEPTAEALAHALVALYNSPRDLEELAAQCVEHPLRPAMLNSSHETIMELEY